MDNITHTLVGIGLAKTGFEKRYGRGATWILAIASNLPDLDVFGGIFLHKDSFLYRRMLTHSVIGVPLLAILFTFLFRKIFKKLGWIETFALTIAGAGVHVLFDLINSYGVVIFYPLSLKRYELAWIFIIDLVLWGLLILPLIMTKGGKSQGSEKVFQFFMALVFLYVSTCGALHARSMAVFKQAMRQHKSAPDFLYVFPEALGPQRFKGVVRTGGKYEMYQVHPFSGEVDFVANFETIGQDPAFASIRENHRVQELEWFFKAPVWKMSPAISGKQDSFQLEVFDLRFYSTVLKIERPPFTFIVPIKAKEALEKPQ